MEENKKAVICEIKRRRKEILSGKVFSGFLSFSIPFNKKNLSPDFCLSRTGIGKR